MKQVDYIIPCSGVGVKCNQNEIDAVVEAIKNADPMTQGRYQQQFEKDFAAYIGVKHAFAFSSCTTALDMTAILAGLTKDDEVIIPAHTFCATAIPFARTGAKIVWADIDPISRLVSADTIKKCLSPKTRMIVVVHLYGLLVDMDPVMEIASRHDLWVVEDVAQAPGARYKGRRAGSIGDFGCFSFHTHKNISTLGEGGMLTVNDSDLAKLVPGLRHNGVRPFPNQEHYWQPGMSMVDFDIDGVWPYNFCLGEIQCAVGIEMLKRLDQMNEERRKRAEKIMSELKAYPELSFQKPNHPSCEHVYHLLIAQYQGNQDELFKLMAYTYKIKVINPYYPLYKYPIFQKSGMGDADCPVTEKYFSQIVAFPFHYWLSENQVEYMIDSIKKALETLRGQR